MDSTLRDLLRCVLTPGMGPVLLDRACSLLGSHAAVLRASARDLSMCEGIGGTKARRLVEGLSQSAALADAELEQAERLGVSLVARGSGAYPEALRSIPAAPHLLYVLGSIEPLAEGVAVVGSRGCTPYGVEQAERLSMGLADSGLTIVSGGARGIDAAAHRGALRARGQTIAVLGCGLSHRYPPEHGPMFDAIVEGGGALVSELPLGASPQARNFPARNRIVSGMSLGVVVVEASAGSGALITARYAAEDHGREVMAVPGRVDSPASEGSHALLKMGGAALVTGVRDVLEAIAPGRRHLAVGTHARRYTPMRTAATAGGGLGEPACAEQMASDALSGLSATERALMEALDEPRTLEALLERSGIEAGEGRASLTMLELRGLVRRSGSVLERDAARG